MSIIEPGYFGSDGRLRQLDDVYFVYTAFCPASDGLVLVKVGMSLTPYNRLLSIDMGSPYPIELAAFCRVGQKSSAAAFEKRMLEAYPDRQTRGEWIDVEDTEEARKHFAKTSGSILRSILKRKPEWKTVNSEQLREYRNLRFWDGKRAKKQKKPLDFAA